MSTALRPSFATGILVLGLLAGWGSTAWPQSSPLAAQQPAATASLIKGDGGLPDGALLRLGVGAFRHSDNLTAVVFSPDGRRIATLGRDHAAAVWDAATGRLVFRVQDREADFTSVAFTLDGQQLVITGSQPNLKEANFIQIYDAATGVRRHQLSGHRQPIYALSFNARGDRFTSISCDQTADWDLAQGKLLDQRHQDWPTGVLAVAAGRPLLAFASNRNGDPFIRCFDVATGKATLTIQGEAKDMPDPDVPGRTRRKIVRPEQAVVALAVSPDGKLVASGSPFEHIRLWDTATGKVVRTLDDPQGGIALAFAADGKRLASGTIGGVVRVWDTATGKELRKLSAMKAWVNALAFSPDGKTLALAGAESRTLYLWDLESGRDLRPGPGHRTAVQGLGFSADGRLLATAGSGRDDDHQCVCVWDAATGKCVHRLGKFDSRVLALAFAADGKRLAVAADQQALPQVIDVPTGKVFDDFEVREGAPGEVGREQEPRFMALAFAPGGGRLAGGSNDGRLFVWDSRTGKCQHCWKGHSAMVTSLAFTPDGKKLMTTAEDRTARLWDVATGTVLLHITHGEDSFQTVRVSDDGKFAAALSAWCDGKLYLWDLATGGELQRIALSPRRINQLALAPNGKMLATSDVDGKICLYEVASGKPRAAFTGHCGEITALAFSPDGCKLASGSADTTVLLWDATDGNQILHAAAQPLSEVHLLKLWRDLGAEDARTAHRAVWQLAANPAEAEAFLRHRLQPAGPRTAAEIQQLVRNLDHANFGKRSQAMQTLLDLGSDAEKCLRAALQQSCSAEAAQRIRVLLDRLDAGELSSEQIRRERALEALGWIGTRPITSDLHAERSSK